MRIGLIVEYEGTAFHGSQLQANVRTVQGELEEAAKVLFGIPRRVKLASRTDAGVHATGQVAALDAETALTASDIRNALNYHLPADIKVRKVAPVEANFDPRRHARNRTYEYKLTDAVSPPVIDRRTSVHVRSRLDHVAMDAACRRLTGERNFAAFAGPATDRDASTVRNVETAVVERSGDTVKFRITANSFLNQQVRRITGVLAEVGRGKAGPDLMRDLLDDPARGAATRVMPAHGLCLMSISYPGGLPGQLPVR